MRIWLVIVVGYWQCVWKKIVSVFVFLFFLFIKYCIIKMIDWFAWSVGRKKSYWNSVAYWLKWLKQKEMLKRAAEKMVRNDEPVTNSILLQLKIPMNHLQIYKYSAVLCICVWMSCFLRYKKKLVQKYVRGGQAHCSEANAKQKWTELSDPNVVHIDGKYSWITQWAAPTNGFWASG